MSISRSYNFRQLNDKLSSSGVVGAKRLTGLAAEGYECVIDLLPHDNQHAVAGEPQIVEAQGLEYIYIPVDWNKPSTQNYHDTAAALAANANRKTHIHCAANWRVSGFYACYAVYHSIWSEPEAKGHITGLWDPREFPQWQSLLALCGLRI